MKKPTIIAASDVPRDFNAGRIRQFAELLEIDASLHEPLAKAIHTLVLVFIDEANTPDDGDVARDIKALYAAMERRDYTALAKLIPGMSKPTRAFLNKRARRIGLTIPKPSAFLDHGRRETACERVRRITSQGGHREDGKWVPHLYLPKRQLELEERVQERIRPSVKAAKKHGVEADVVRRRILHDVRAEMVKDAKAHGVDLELRPPKRMTAVNFVNGLQIAFKIITGREPPVEARAADGTGTPGPFGQVAQQCLDLMLMGADKKTDAVGAINQLRSRHPEKRPSKKREESPVNRALFNRRLFLSPDLWLALPGVHTRHCNQ
jgi:hypothetical protein